MNDIIKAWSKPRTVFSFMLYGVFCYLCIRNKITSEIFVNIFLVISGYWFGERANKNKIINK